MHEQAEEIVDFWFSEATRPYWYNATPEFDAQLNASFGELMRAARAGKLADWSHTARGALALVILLDQFPRNIHRGTPESFASDAAARTVATQALAAGLDAEVDEQQRAFFYLPFMHSEQLTDQDRCVALCEKLGAEETVKYARLHRDLIVRFGRFPHRNRILNRESSAAELDYLASEDAFQA